MHQQTGNIFSPLLLTGEVLPLRNSDRRERKKDPISTFFHAATMRQRDLFLLQHEGWKNGAFGYIIQGFSFLSFLLEAVGYVPLPFSFHRERKTEKGQHVFVLVRSRVISVTGDERERRRGQPTTTLLQTIRSNNLSVGR